MPQHCCALITVDSFQLCEEIKRDSQDVRKVHLMGKYILEICVIASLLSAPVELELSVVCVQTVRQRFFRSLIAGLLPSRLRTGRSEEKDEKTHMMSGHTLSDAKAI